MFAEHESTEDPILETVEPVISGLGYTLVDIQSKFVRDRLRVIIVIYRESGITVDDCAAVHHAVQPRIEVLQDNRDVYLEVSSPGVDRKFRTNREFAVFKGRGARVLRGDNDQWVAGVIVEAKDGTVILENDSGREAVAMELIRKARLDESQEVRH
ncbi:MAG: ribosome assembly cofactor RimP [Spirochaetota bacterium]